MICLSCCAVKTAISGFTITRKVMNKLVFYAHMVTSASFCNDDNDMDRGWMGEMEVEGQEIAHHHHDGANAIDTGSLLLLILGLERR